MQRIHIICNNRSLALYAFVPSVVIPALSESGKLSVLYVIARRPAVWLQASSISTVSPSRIATPHTCPPYGPRRTWICAQVELKCHCHNHHYHHHQQHHHHHRYHHDVIAQCEDDLSDWCGCQQYWHRTANIHTGLNGSRISRVPKTIFTSNGSPDVLRAYM